MGPRTVLVYLSDELFAVKLIDYWSKKAPQFRFGVCSDEAAASKGLSAEPVYLFISDQMGYAKIDWNHIDVREIGRLVFLKEEEDAWVDTVKGRYVNGVNRYQPADELLAEALGMRELVNAAFIGDENSFGKSASYLDLPVRPFSELGMEVRDSDDTEQEQRLRDLSQSLEAEEGGSRLDDTVELPSEWNGKKITFVEETDKISVLQVLLMGGVAAAGWFVLSDRNLIEKSKKRSEQMEADYPEVVLKLAVLLRAGLNVRSAWERIVENYKKHDRNGRYVYEEMGQTLIKIQGGRSEGEAYLEFGRRTHLHSYLKLSSLLEQNMKKGGKNLVRLLESEAEESWHNRKDTALKKGEEAGTKMILPMMMLLIVVMIVIMAPAMFSFY